MLLRDYLLLSLGRTTEAEVAGWRADMVARRRVDATRDLLASWRKSDEELRVTVILAPRRGLALEVGLREAVARALTHFPSGVAVQAVAVSDEDGVLVGDVALRLGGSADRRAVANALAYYFEETFGYAQASKHPVAYEESMRPGH